MKCVYCGKEYNEGGTSIKVSNGNFDVCSSECKHLVNEYLEKDQIYKPRSYVLIFCGSLGFIISTIWNSGIHHLLPMYIGMIVMGVSLMIYPYIFTSFGSFVRHPIIKMNKTVRIIGGVIVLISAIFLALEFIL